VGYWLQSRSFSAEKKRRDDDRAELRKGQAYALLFKLIRIASSLKSLSEAVLERPDIPAERGQAARSWQWIQPIANPPDAVKFSPEEMALVFSLNSNVFNQIAALDDLHNSTVAIFAAYGVKRSAVTERLGGTMEGPIGTSALTREQVEWLGPRAAELDSLVVAMIDRTEKDAREARAALLALSELFNEKLKLNHRLEFVQPS
jgi:hypothetical protein